MNKIFIAFLAFLVFPVWACNKEQSLTAARQHVIKESPKGSKITLQSTKDTYIYTALLADESGTYTGTGTLKVSSDCSVQTISSSVSNQSASGSSSSYSSSSK